mmetsp:Transcript_18911/g.40536  ORF Transcript_18911/g.40536 Transcript_18911/m.40536 type:complete len:336 (+) Transcript_18911:288-1295(+)|eukprot:CAMPEP_0172543094 /NCGR_PEP_ID=MMETSP1067-20121228/13568_1 /TAXON_ID=265564 ORGANISM="Thalassiosira punctigera, Strain Tpunct2005C2" /NCGR_SAMPLE_ID=MMETSP1067 /ASSEMBLY_ACC=CAM_ASM_000444 /LENGTH=335 /DNA_ID=CAMNT_0013329439 /DNA_START=245 /DNA_END=1252 /DNA_ORIENTATION=-
MSAETIEEMTARQKKELKSFEGEKRAAIKNAKSRGKKAKSAVKDAEFKYQGLERDLKERHRLEMDQLNGGGEGGGTEEEAADKGEKAETGQEETAPQPTTTTPSEEQPTPKQIEEAKRQKAIQKKLKKKNAQRQKEIEREKQIYEENSKAGPSRRQMEMEALQTLYLHPRGLDVQEIEADGNCLYRAVGVQCSRLGLDAVDVDGEDCYVKIREICADVLLGSNRAEYEPFAECGEGHAVEGNNGGNHPATFEEYVKNVRSTSTWGGQLELRALSEGLKRPIVVFSAEGSPLTMGSEYAPDAGNDDNDWGKKEALLLSYHRHYYALGEHYNSIIPK